MPSNSLAVKYLCATIVRGILACDEGRSESVFPKSGFPGVENATGVAF